MTNHKDDEIILADRINDFLVKNRKPILGGIALICAVLLTISVYLSVSSKKKTGALAAAEKIVFDLNKFKTDFKAEKEKTEIENKKDEDKKSEEQNSSDKTETEEEIPEEIKQKEDEAVAELQKIVSANKNTYAAYFACSAIADIYIERKDFQKALENYETAAGAISKSYTAGIAYFNAAVCSEELGNKENALEFYKKSAEVENFALKPRAMFNEGRLNEALKNIEAAIEAYKKLSEKYPDNEWALMGKSRMIELEIQKSKEM